MGEAHMEEGDIMEVVEDTFSCALEQLATECSKLLSKLLFLLPS